MRTLEILKRIKPSHAQLISGSLILSAGMLVYAVPNVFTAGTTTSAAQMNANFTDVEARIAALEAKLANVTNITVNGQPTVRFSGVNVQVINGAGSTATANGTGNLIVGYDEADASGIGLCTLGTDPGTGAAVTSSGACTTAGGTWSTTGFKTGSHYVVTGAQNNYSSWGGLMAGYRNTSNYRYASVTGGTRNVASGDVASVSGGYLNTSNGIYTSVNGGQQNVASGNVASVSGGVGNTASGPGSSLSGGYSNTASGNYASVSGGTSNTAAGTTASVSGGQACSTGAVTNKWIVGQSGSAACSATLGN